MRSLTLSLSLCATALSVPLYVCSSNSASWTYGDVFLVNEGSCVYHQPFGYFSYTSANNIVTSYGNSNCNSPGTSTYLTNHCSFNVLQRSSPYELTLSLVKPHTNDSSSASFFILIILICIVCFASGAFGVCQRRRRARATITSGFAAPYMGIAAYGAHGAHNGPPPYGFAHTPNPHHNQNGFRSPQHPTSGFAPGGGTQIGVPIGGGYVQPGVSSGFAQPTTSGFAPPARSSGFSAPTSGFGAPQPSSQVSSGFAPSGTSSGFSVPSNSGFSAPPPPSGGFGGGDGPTSGFS